MDSIIWHTENELDLTEVASGIIEVLKTNRILLLKGDLGAGKTTLVKEICRLLKVRDLVNSPTYSIVNQYKLPTDKTIFHFDLYRLSYEELFDLGFEEYLRDGDLIFIEWPEVASEFYTKDTLLLNISNEGDARKYELTSFNN